MQILFKYFSFFCLAISFLATWCSKKSTVLGALFAISYFIAIISGVAEIWTLLPITALAGSIYLWSRQKGEMIRLFLFLLTILLSYPFISHLFKGFHNWNILRNVQISRDSAPFNLWINFDKPLPGFFLLALSIPLLNRNGLKKIWKKTALLLLFTILFMTGISYAGGGIHWDPKIPPFALIWTINNLLLVSIPEEAFFRGFIQNELSRLFGKNIKGAILAIVITSLGFAILHYNWVEDPAFLGLVFLASIIYGAIYQYTGAIESSIITHFLLNVVHFYFFTYPAILK